LAKTFEFFLIFIFCNLKMKDIKCPSCGKTFRIDPSSFEEILLQIKDEEFNKQIKHDNCII